MVLWSSLLYICLLKVALLITTFHASNGMNLRNRNLTNGNGERLHFDFTLEIDNIVQPKSCQGANAISTIIKAALNSGLVGSVAASYVVKIGCVRLSYGMCGGCLGTAYDDNSSTTTSITVAVISKSRCYNSSCLQSLYESITDGFRDFIGSGVLTHELQTYAMKSIPNVMELYYAEVITDSISAEGYKDPFALKPELGSDVIYVPDWTLCSCTAYTKDSRDLMAIQHNEFYTFQSASVCCGALFGFRKTQCCEEAGGCDRNT